MKLGICGHFGGKENFLNGQTVRTKSVTAVLADIVGESNVTLVDTYKAKKRIISVLFGVFRMFLKCDVCVMFPCSNGLKVFAPIYVLLSKILKKNIYYVAIGGWLPSFLDGKKSLANKLKKFNRIFVQTSAMKKKLEDDGFDNIVILPNFKEMAILEPQELTLEHSQPYKLCTFSRVMKEKGIEDAVEAVKKVNDYVGKVVYSLDIYGQVDVGYRDAFESLKKTFPDYINYGGEVPYNKSTSVLKDYYLLLFPTFYFGEGFAGTLIDAYSSGLPVVASDWKYNSEFIDSDVGFLFETGNVEELTNILIDIYNQKYDILSMKTNCIEKAKLYTAQNAKKILQEYIV